MSYMGKMIIPYYKNDWVTLYHGDCLQIMPQLDIKFDACITDPPYGTAKGMAIQGWKNKKETLSWDNSISPINIFNNVIPLLHQNKKLILFSQQPYTSNLITN